ncbi:MAG TPA: hypothetical protein VMX17_17685 [Candidatus Glassbacteria bacterium]|nr:hypothetical protein [Candidatus Glassbacteria bacterium]
MSDKKNYLIADEEGNLYGVNSWVELFEVLEVDELEDLYVVTKYTHSLEEAMIELEEKNVIEQIKGGVAPIEDIANSLDKISEQIGLERTKELDAKVKALLDSRSKDIDPSSFMHLN